MKSVLFKIKGMHTQEDRINVMNAIHKYSGVLYIDVNMHDEKVKVDYDPNNITVGDMRRYIESENYTVDVLSYS
ncbi:heavy-metal-associated domain-containing protein [Desulfotruncus alcoholivorax]|uniref:heavy-metal-associated domain-containing protein n=1 Tax=Desulfotruncus alcoholivorax TaxID=265477 RepID=UPI0004263F27|nr:heavy-metal-associated domain-containing protein [Desulfotruncus alcoholivorax]